jgi:predicted GNAT family acetyltransferase
MESHLVYRQIDDHTVNYYHTYVPPELRNQGIALTLVTEAAKYALENDLSVIPSCSYVDVFFRRHPEYAKALNT